MIKGMLMRKVLFHFIIGVIILTSCAVPPARTEIPTLQVATETIQTYSTVVPSTSTPAPTTTPTPALSPIILAMSPVVTGQSIPDATEYDPKRAGPHHLVILTTSGTAYSDWNEKIPFDWLSPSVSGIELVVVISPERKIIYGTQTYTKYSYDSDNTLHIENVDFTAYRYEADLEIREAHSGRILVTSTLKDLTRHHFLPLTRSTLKDPI